MGNVEGARIVSGAWRGDAAGQVFADGAEEIDAIRCRIVVSMRNRAKIGK